MQEPHRPDDPSADRLRERLAALGELRVRLEESALRSEVLGIEGRTADASAALQEGRDVLAEYQRVLAARVADSLVEREAERAAEPGTADRTPDRTGGRTGARRGPG